MSQIYIYYYYIQALENAPTDLFKSSTSVVSTSTGGKEEEDDGLGDMSKWYTPEACWWVDLETIHGGDPLALPILRKLAQTLQVELFTYMSIVYSIGTYLYTPLHLNMTIPPMALYWLGCSRCNSSR